MTRLRSNFQRGTLTSGITSLVTTVTAAAFSSLPVVTSPDYLVIVLDPEAVYGNPELVKVTTHTSASTSLTVTRGYESTTARTHLAGVTWRHVPTSGDWGYVDNFVNVKEVGQATGDGVTDDTTAITNAESVLAALGGGTLYFPYGTYLVSSYLTYSSNQRWLFEPGAVIKLASGAVANLLRSLGGSTLGGMIQPAASSGISRVVFEGLTLDGNKANNPTVNSGNGLEIYGPISNVRVLGYSNSSICENGLEIGKLGSVAGVPTAVRIEDYVSVDCGLVGVSGGSAIAITEGLDIKIDGFNISNALLTGIDLEPNSTAAKILAGVRIRDGAIDGTSSHTTTYGLSISPKNVAQSIFDVLISGVEVQRCTYGFSESGTGGLAATAADYVRHIACVAFNNQYDGFTMGGGLRASFVDCTADSNSQFGASAGHGFRLFGTTYCRLRDCDSIGGSLQKYGFTEESGANHNLLDGCGGSGNVTSLYNVIGGSSSNVNDLAG